MKRFSDQFPSFFDWKNNSKDTSYSKRVSRLHYFYPNATLRQLAGREKLSSKRLPISLVDPRGLLPSERKIRNDSLHILGRIRRSEDPHKVISDYNLSPEKLEKYLGNNLKHTKNTVKASSSDKIPREMIISENGIETSVIIRNSKSASIIGKYQNAKRYFLESGDDSKLKEFSKIKLKDIDGKIHRFETNPEKIIDIEDRKEEPESFEIYKS
jgi:hypothetical protein